MQKIQAWIRRITDNEMPIFGRTVQEVVSVSEDDDTSAGHLSQVVLKDAAMTSRVLKLANSSFYNAGRQRLSTVSRAIMMLGFDTVRSMCVTVALIDSLVKGVNRHHLVREMARALHAATQAQQIAIQRKDANPEEVFICTLLYNIGDLAFWCFAGKEGEQIDVLLNTGETPESAQREVLGFTLRELSEGLAREWSLSELLQNTLAKPEGNTPRTRTITLSHQLAIATEEGWDSAAVTKLTSELANLAGISADTMEKQLHENAQRAVVTTATYGASDVANAIPTANEQADEGDQDTSDDNAAPPSTTPNPGLQLQILRELTGLMTSKTSFNTVVEMAMEGLHRGVGLPRVLFALLSPDRSTLKPKFVLGDDEGLLKFGLEIPIGGLTASPIRYVLSKRSCLWTAEIDCPDGKAHLTEAFFDATASREMYMAPVIIRDKPVGIFYADAAGQALDQARYDAFRHFSQQAVLVLNHLATQRG